MVVKMVKEVKRRPLFIEKWGSTPMTNEGSELLDAS